LLLYDSIVMLILEFFFISSDEHYHNNSLLSDEYVHIVFLHDAKFDLGKLYNIY
jgi:hypothetical protein